MPGLFERARAAWRAFQQREVPPLLRGEVAFAESRLLFTDKFAKYNPSELVTRKGLQQFDKMRNDEQVKAAMLLKKHAVVGTGWAVEAAKDRPEDDPPAMFLRHVISTMPGTFEERVHEILTALEYGYSVTEMVLSDIEEGDWVGHVGLTLKGRRPHDFAFYTDPHGNLLPDGVEQQSPAGIIRLPTEKFILFQNQPEFSNPYGRSDLEAAYRGFWYKTQAYQWMGMLLERYGIPPMFALYDRDQYTGPELDTLKTILARLQAATVGMIPRGNKDGLDMWSPEMAGQVATAFAPALDRYDKDIARAILVPGLLGMTPDDVTGSQARSRVHFDVFMLVVEFVRTQLEEILNERMVRPLHEFNFSDPQAPRLRFMPISEDVRLGILDRWIKLVDGEAVQRREGDERHIRSLLEFPQVPEEESDEPLESEEPIEEEPEEEEPEEDEEEISEEQRAVQHATDVSNMDLTEPEKRVDFARVERQLDEAEQSLGGRLRSAAQRLRLSVEKRLLAGEERSKIIRSLRADRRTIRNVMERSLVATARNGQRDLRREVSGASEYQGDPGFIPDDMIEFIRVNALIGADKYSEDLEALMRQTIASSIQAGESGRVAARRIRLTLQDYEGASLEDANPTRIERIVRTNHTRAYNAGRLVELRRLSERKIVKGAQYSAVMDSRTSAICRKLHGRIFKPDDPDLDNLTPPNHYNCRSALIAVTITDNPQSGNFITDTQKAEANQLGGQGFVKPTE